MRPRTSAPWRDLARHHQIGEQPRHRRQAPLDRRRGQACFAVTQPHHVGVDARTALRSDERQHILCRHISRLLVDLGEEHPQVRRRRQQRVAASSCLHELEIAVDDWMAETRRRINLRGASLTVDRSRQSGFLSALAPVPPTDTEKHRGLPAYLHFIRALSSLGGDEPRPGVVKASPT